MPDTPTPPPTDPAPEDLDEDYDPTEKGAAGPIRSVSLDEAFLRVVANDLWEESGFDIDVGDALNIFGERGPNPGRPENQMPQGPPRRRPRPDGRPPSPALLETLDILSDPDTMSALAEASRTPDPCGNRPPRWDSARRAQAARQQRDRSRSRHRI